MYSSFPISAVIGKLHLVSLPRKVSSHNLTAEVVVPPGCVIETGMSR